MKINTTLKILMCTSALVLAGVSTASAHQHEAGEAAATQMKEKAKDKAMDMAADQAKNKAKDHAKDIMVGESQSMEKGASETMQEKAGSMAMDKAKGMAKDKVLGKASGGVAGQVEHKMKEKAMDHAMDKAEGSMMEHAKDKAEGSMMEHAKHKAEGAHTMEDGTVMTGKEHGMEHKMSAPAATEPMKLISFDEALAVCRANASADLQACVDKHTGQGALRKQMNGS
jgi:hypothetical protein